MAFVLTTADEITEAIDSIIADVCPSAGRRPMYGGIVFEREPGVHRTMVCGHFVYKKHVSLEFGDGYRFSDPESVLEGKGKYRRHIKLTSPGDIESKCVRAMIKQAFSKQMSEQ
ncbi:MAG: DUF1801 domain-containing protein [Woeseiaceae bacterium]